MNYTEMLFNRDERLVNLLNQADSKNLELIEEINNREDEIERLHSIIKEVREYISSIETDYAIGCWNKEDEFIDVKKDILEILEKEN